MQAHQEPLFYSVKDVLHAGVYNTLIKRFKESMLSGHYRGTDGVSLVRLIVKQNNTLIPLSFDLRTRMQKICGDDYGRRETVHRVMACTGRINTWTPETDFDKLLENYKSASSQKRAEIKSTFHLFLRMADDGGEWAQRVIFREEIEAFADNFDYVWLARNNVLVSRDDLEDCVRCDESFQNFELSRVYTGDNTSDFELCCAECQSNYSDEYRTCDVSRLVFRYDAVYFVNLNSDECCAHDYCINMGLIESDYDEDEDETTYNRVGHHQGLPQYHRSAKPWQNSSFIMPARAFGVELEIGFAGGNAARAKFIREHVGNHGRFKNLPFSCEADSSLEGIPGPMEIISDPLEYHAGYRAKGSPWRTMLDMLHVADARGWQHRALAGIHVNMDVQHVTKDDVFKYVVFISNAAALSKFVAGRHKIFGVGDHDEGPNNLGTTQYAGGYEKKEARHYRKLTVAQAYDSFTNTSKYTPVRIRENGKSIETRIFSSNIKFEGFMAYVEYCMSVMDFCVSRSVVDIFSPTISAEYRNWLGPRVRNYPHITAKIGIIEHPFGQAVPSNGARVVPLRAVA